MDVSGLAAKLSDSCDPMDCSLPGSSVHGILQERILEWVAISFSRGTELGSPALQADSLLTELGGKPILCPVLYICQSQLGLKQF